MQNESSNSYIRDNSNLWKTSKYYGYITSRIYLGSYSNIPIDQINKEYTYVKGSWSHLDYIRNSNKSNLYTASTFATKFLGNYMSKQSHLQKKQNRIILKNASPFLFLNNI